MVSKSKICLICKQDSNILNSIVPSDVQIIFNENEAVDVCNSCLGKFELILQFRKSLKRTKNKQRMCSICTKVSLYLFTINQNNNGEFIEKIKYCQTQGIVHPLKNACYRCLYLTDLWYDLKKQYETVITNKVKSTPVTSEKNSRSGLKRKLSLTINTNQEKSEMKSPNKKRKSDTSVAYGGSGTTEQNENTKLQKLQRKLQLDIRDADAYLKPTKSKRRRNSEISNDSVISINDSVENVTINDLKPANTYFTKHRKKWLTPQIKSDSKLLNLICNVDLSTSLIPPKVLKRLNERNFVRVKTIASEIENEEETPPASTPPVKKTKSSAKTKKFTAARKFPKTVPKTKRNFQNELEEIQSCRSTNSPPLCKSPVSDRTDFDYGMNRHSYDAFSTDKEKVVMVLLHNVEQFEKKSNKRISDDVASISSSSTDKTECDDIHTEDTHNEDTHNEDIHNEDTHNEDTHNDDTHNDDTHNEDTHNEDTHNDDTHNDDTHNDDTHNEDTSIDEDEQRLGRFSCLENYMAGFPRLVLDRMDNNVNENASKMTTKRTNLKDLRNDDTEEYITPEKNQTFDDIRREIESRVRKKMELLNSPKSNTEDSKNTTSIKSSSDNDIQNSQTSLTETSKNLVGSNAASDEGGSTANETDSQEDAIKLRLSEEDTEKQTAENEQQIDAATAEKSIVNENNSIEIDAGDDDDDVVCLDQQEEIVESRRNGDITNTTVDTVLSDKVIENIDQDEVQCNVEITTTTTETNQNDLNEDVNTDQEDVTNMPANDQQFCEVAQKLAELDA